MLQKFYVILAVGAFIIDKNQLLIVKKSPLEKIDGGLWTIPGGKKDIKKRILEIL